MVKATGRRYPGPTVRYRRVFSCVADERRSYQGRPEQRIITRSLTAALSNHNMNVISREAKNPKDDCQTTKERSGTEGKDWMGPCWKQEGLTRQTALCLSAFLFYYFIQLIEDVYVAWRGRSYGLTISQYVYMHNINKLWIGLSLEFDPS